MTTPREAFIAALERRPLPGLVPHFEIIFSPTMEAFGRVHPLHRNYAQWDQMKPGERRLHIREMADLHIQIAEKYQHSAIVVIQISSDEAELFGVINEIRDRVGDRYCLLCTGDATFAIPDGDGIVEFSYRMADEPEKLHAEAEEKLSIFTRRAERLKKNTSIDGMVLCSDYCFNTGPFLSPLQFSEFIAPYLARQVQAFRDMGYYVIKHTDGNILPILDQLVQAKPHAIHSLDPQAGIDIADIIRRVGSQVCLCGNVDCGLMDTGTEAQVEESARYALRSGLKADGYIFSSSNCIYTGLPLERYELVWRILQAEGVRPAP